MWGKERLELALGVQGGGGQHSGVDPHCDLMNNACRVRDAVGRLEDRRSGGHRRRQEVGHGCSRDQRTRRRVG